MNKFREWYIHISTAQHIRKKFPRATRILGLFSRFSMKKIRELKYIFKDNLTIIFTEIYLPIFHIFMELSFMEISWVLMEAMHKVYMFCKSKIIWRTAIPNINWKYIIILFRITLYIICSIFMAWFQKLRDDHI